MWKSTVGERPLHFRLAGINNQNFLMRDIETGTWWQQVSGKAVAGPLKGQALELAPYDELSFALWKQESPAGLVLAPVKQDASQYESNWEPETQKLPTVIDFPGSGLAGRDVVVGVEVNGVSRAYPFSALQTQSPIQDLVGGVPILLAVGPDGESVRGFVRRIDGQEADFFRKTEGAPDWALVDSRNATSWNFQGCPATDAQSAKCLERIAALKDYWFDWKNYHPATSIYQH